MLRDLVGGIVKRLQLKYAQRAVPDQRFAFVQLFVNGGDGLFADIPSKSSLRPECVQGQPSCARLQP